jgi:hypothetical protein
MKNKLSDLNNHLFEQLERLNDDDLKGEELGQEINRAHAMTNIAAQIINNASLVLKANVAADSANGKLRMPILLGE